MANMDDVAKKILAGKKLKKAEPGKGKIKLPPPNAGMKAAARRAEADNRIFDKHGRPGQGKALKKAESTAPAKSEAVKKSAPKNVNEAKKAKRVIGGVLPETKPAAKPFNFKVSQVDDVFKAPVKKGVGKAIKKGIVGAASLIPVGLGINALMEGLDAEEAGSEEEDMEAAATRQGEKTAKKIAADKSADRSSAKSVTSLKASTKKRVSKAPVKALPKAVKKTAVEKPVYTPKPRSDESIVEGFNKQLDKNFGPVEIEGLENVEKVMRSEMKKGAKESNKKPISKYLKR